MNRIFVLTRRCGKSAVAMNMVLHRVYLTTKDLSRWIEEIYQET
jgi:hypothetical protein